MLIAEGVNKTLGRNKVLHDVSIAIKPGEITALLGPSGSGKSTLLRALSLLEPPDSGIVRLDDMSYTFPAGAKQKARHSVSPWPDLTVVFQQLFLWPHLTIRRNVMIGLEGKSEATWANKASDRQFVDELLEVFELTNLADRFPNEISTGQKQRAALVRALALRPKYLLLDEITSALDIEHIAKVLDYLKRLRSDGTGILIITHLIGFARSAADQVVFMEGGRVLEQGDGRLLTHPRSERLIQFLSLVETAS